MASISAATKRVKDNVRGWIDEQQVRQACAAAEHGWRARVLTPWVLLQLFALQVLHGNVACRTLMRLSELDLSVQAYSQARMNLPLDVFGHVAAALTHEARQQVADFGRWLGHRVMHIDGTGLSMADEPVLRLTYGQPRGQKLGCGFPVMHVLWLFDAATGLIVDFITNKCYTADMADAAKLHTLMEEGDVMVGDRAFGTFAHLALLLQSKLDGVFRSHHRQIVNFRPGRKSKDQRRKGQRAGAPTSRWIRSLGREDQIVSYVRPKSRPQWMSEEEYAQLPARIEVRELRYRITRRGYRTRIVTLVTTLLDPRKYSKQELAKLYGARWQIETNLKHLKQTMGMNVLRCQTAEGVKKECWMYLIVYNQVRLFMLDAAGRQGVAPDRVSFIDALDVLCYCNPIVAAALKLVVNPHRPDRHEPRVIKRRKDGYRYMTKPREELRKDLGITRIPKLAA
jgi:hypothetical protein